MSTPQLYWLGEDGEEKILPLVASEIRIGRKGDADIVLNNQHVSRNHAKLIKTAEGYLLQDGWEPEKPSTHGTFVNEAQIKQYLLKHGDRILLGKDRIELQYFVGELKQKSPKADTTQIFERSLID